MTKKETFEMMLNHFNGEVEISEMTEEELTAAGVPSDLVRLSCGLESAEDLVADIKQALDCIGK